MKHIGLDLRFQDGYDMAVAGGVVRYARSKSDWILRGQGPWFSFKEDLSECDGLIARIESKEEAGKIHAYRIPVVDIASAVRLPTLAQVHNDDHLTGKRAGAYLKGLGIEHFGYCGAEGLIWAQERLAGYREEIDGEVFRFFRPLGWWRALYGDDEELGRWLGSLPKPVALFCCNDLSALKVQQQLKHLSIAIPEECVILGVDDEELVCELANPSISSIRIQCDEIGFQASKLLDELLGGTGEGAVRRVIEPGVLVERESTRLVGEDDEHVSKALLLIKARATGGLTASDVASNATICRRALEIRFRKILGSTIWKEITKAKLEHATTLLKHTSDPIERISEACGFGSTHRFHTLFKRTYRTTPQRYRIREQERRRR
ncbi:MAG: substrate-binding domain-containing protein [Spirochaetales bacterium]|nr:substrate-binding domain-containing protein [Spirochaetales bacterium]